MVFLSCDFISCFYVFLFLDRFNAEPAGCVGRRRVCYRIVQHQSEEISSKRCDRDYSICETRKFNQTGIDARSIEEIR